MRKKLIMISFLPFVSTYTVANFFLTNEEIPKYDINSTLGEELFSGGSFINGISNSLFADSGNSYSGYYRGITSLAEGESDFYSFYDESEDNTFLRLANYNGEEDSYRTRSSFYFFDNEKNVPENLPSTSYMNVAFDYRFFVGRNFILGLEIMPNVYSQILFLQIPDMPKTRLHNVIRS